MSLTRVAVAVLAASMTSAACSGEVSFSISGQSPESAAETVIEGEIADLLGWELVATCPDADDPTEGDTFSCTAPAPGGETIEFLTTVGDGEVDVQTTNVLRADAVELFEAAALDLVRADTGAPYPDGSLECTDDAIVLPADGVVDCVLTDPTGSTQAIEMYDIDPESGDFFIRAG